MAEIDNWIKKQLKKGYKKEQIKEGLRLRKADYLPEEIWELKEKYLQPGSLV